MRHKTERWDVTVSFIPTDEEELATMTHTILTDNLTKDLSFLKRCGMEILNKVKNEDITY